MLPLLPIGVGILALTAWFASSKRPPKVGASIGADTGMTPARRIIYQTALCSVKDPEQLESLAATFRGEGLTVQAEMLTKRANLRRLPKEVKDARAEAFRKGMKCNDPAQVMMLANAFENEGATGAAAALKAWAEGLKQNVS